MSVGNGEITELDLNLDVDLQRGVVPISKAASALAALLKRAKENHMPIIVTQKGYPTGVILDIATFTTLKGLMNVEEEDNIEA